MKVWEDDQRRGKKNTRGESGGKGEGGNERKGTRREEKR